MNTKKIISALLVTAAASALLLTSCSTSDINPPNGMQLACDTTLTDYYFFVPEEWTVDTTTSASGAYYTNSDPSSVSFMVWELDYTDTTVESWWEDNMTDLARAFNDIEVVSEANTTIDGNYAKSYIYTCSLGEYSYRIQQTACIKDTRLFLFTYTSLDDTFDSHLEDVDEIVSNIIIK